VPLVVLGKDEGLDKFVEDKTRFTRKNVEGEAWQKLFEKAQEESIYLPVGTVPLEGLEDADNPSYSLEMPGRYPVFLWAGFISTDSAIYNRDISWGMTHPYSYFAPWLIGTGILFYIVIPWRRLREQEAGYVRWRSVIGPDILGLFLGGFFMILPLLILPQMSSHPRPLDFAQGQGWFSLVFWYIALIGLTMIPISLWYENLRFVVTPEGITKINLLGQKYYSFDQMVSVEDLHWSPPAWFRKVAWLVVLFNWQLAVIMLGSHQVNYGVRVRCRDGRVLDVWAKHLNGYEMILKSFQEEGISNEVSGNE